MLNPFRSILKSSLLLLLWALRLPEDSLFHVFLEIKLTAVLMLIIVVVFRVAVLLEIKQWELLVIRVVIVVVAG